MTLEGYDGSARILVSYDVAGEARSKAARVCQIVFGRTRVVGEPAEVREERGFIHRPGVVWIGQSVLAMPPGERRDRMVRMRHVVAQHNIYRWAGLLLGELAEFPVENLGQRER